MRKIWGVVKPILKAVFSVIKLCCDFCFLIVLLYGIICIPLLAEYKMYVVENENNEIHYKKGTVVYYKKAADNGIYEKDIIVYKPAQEMIFHKVLRVINPSDNKNPIPEVEGEKKNEYSYEVEVDSYHTEYPNHVYYSSLLGKVAPIYLPYVGYFVSFIKMNMPLFYIILGISAVDLIISFLPIPRSK